MKINIIEYFEKTYREYPSKIAIIDNQKKITFTELQSKSKSVATVIIDIAEIIKEPVAVYLPKSAENIIANIGIIYSGNIYVNLDTKTPLNRINNILENINPFAIITNKENIEKLTQLEYKTHIILIDEIINENLNFDNDKILARLDRIIDTDPACIINTSGSTGTPKGVVLNHKAFIDFTEWSINTLKISNDEIIGSLSPFFFDIYSFELCLLMAKSATIAIIPDSYSTFPVRIINFLRDNSISFIFWVPTIMVNISNMNLLQNSELNNLSKILFAGEVFPTRHLNYWRRYIPNATFINLYGPIEITLDCTYYIVNRDFADDEPIPIGYPCRNTDILILNDKDESSQIDEPGELCVRGTSLALGYWNDPEKTAKAFVQNPLNKMYPELIYRTGDLVLINENNEIMFLGRKDFQIKHLGYRIELTEIEHVLVNKIDSIENACVLYNFEKKKITLFYESKNSLTPEIIRSKLSEILPKYMLPTVFYHFDILPRNQNGKIDRQLLKEKYFN